VLERVLERDSALIDCGANIGYWSVWATGFIEDPKRIIAIEASPLLNEFLEENASLNARAFTPIGRAVWSKSDLELEMPVDRKRHAWGSLAADVKSDLVDAGFETARVPTITIDDAIERNGAGDAPLVVLKIDVEGAEIEALGGARKALEGNVLVVYEDHARDTASGITRHVIEELNLEVFYCDEESRVLPVPDVRSAGISKSSAGRGYNFFACRTGTPIAARLRELVDD
jgi:FkbM family methyltransferase